MHEKTHIVIKNMVCNRCIKVVREEFEKLGLSILDIQLGEVTVAGNSIPLDEIKTVLAENGFELVEDKKAVLINRIKSLIIELVYSEQLEDSGLRFSDYITERLEMYDYQYLSSLFSSIENITIEHYFILQKIERAKELLKYDELTLSEIAYRLGYSSVAHLSAQFKRVTGLTASQFKNLSGNNRIPIDKLT
ncbi:MAG: AraC family transcriptional regulator [Bacteroidota bacterium]